MKRVSYKGKKVIKNKDGDESVVYEYSQQAINKRHKEKSEKIEKLRKNIDKLEKTLKEDLKSNEMRDVALAVSLINLTYERVGNDNSANNGHFGVTGWQKKHIKFKGDKATLSYVGKSGVKQNKEVTDKTVVKLLKDISKDKKSDECILSEVSSTDVNTYLSEFDITAKDLRGYHANREVQERLAKLRKENGDLPEDKKEREKQLKEEFKQVIEETAEVIGHKPATLRGQYLVPHLEETFMKDGTVITSLKQATSSNSEKETKEDERLVRQAPKKKPPRKDKRRNRVQDSDTKEKDPDKEQDKKDTSKNYKDAIYRVALRYMLGESAPEKVTVKRKEDGKTVQVSEDTLKGPEGNQYEEIEETESDPDAAVEEPPTEETPAKPKPKKRTKREQKQLNEKLESFADEFPEISKEEIEEALGELDWSAGTLKEDLKDFEEDLKMLQKEIFEENPRLKTESIIRNEIKDVPQYIVDQALQTIGEENDIDVDNLAEVSAKDLDFIMEEMKSLRQNFNKGRVETPREIQEGIDELKGAFESSLAPSDVKKFLKKVQKGTPAEFRKIRREMEKAEAEEDKKRKEEFAAQAEILREKTPEERNQRKKELEDKKNPNPAQVRELLSIQEFEKNLKDPVEKVLGSLPPEGTKLEGDAETKVKETGQKTFEEYKNADPDDLAKNIEKFDSALKEMDPTDARAVELNATIQGMRMAEYYAQSQKDNGENTRGMGGGTARVIDYVFKKDPSKVGDLVAAEVAGKSSPADAQAQKIISDTLGGVTDTEWIDLIPEGHPARSLAEILADNHPTGKARFLSEQDRDFMRKQIQYIMSSDIAYGDAADLDATDGKGTVKENRDLSKERTKGINFPSPDDFETTEEYNQAVEKATREYEQAQTAPFNGSPNEDVSGVINFEDRAEQMRIEQENKRREMEAEREKKIKEMSNEDYRKMLDEERAQRRIEIENRRRMTASTRRNPRKGNDFSINSLYQTPISNQTYLGRGKMRKISKREVLSFTKAMDEMATTLSKLANDFGIPSQVVEDYVLRTDMISDAIERNAGFDPSEIAEVVPGPLENGMVDNGAELSGHFTGIDGEELGDMQENGSFSNSKAASRRLRANRTKRSSTRRRR